MKQWLGTIILVAFLVVTGLGFMAMNGHSSMAGCVASMVNGDRVPCPQGDLLAFIDFHMSAFRTTVGMVSDMAVLSFFAMVLLALLGALVSQALFTAAPFTTLQLVPVSAHSQPQRLLAWLALHEKRDPAHN